jgi:hypothetical protein
MQRVQVSVRRDTLGNRSCHSALMILLCLLVFVTVSFFMRGAYNDLREELIQSLKRERDVAETNTRLKMELAGITRARYLEFRAKEKLGLKKPKEEEVLVLR